MSRESDSGQISLRCPSTRGDLWRSWLDPSRWNQIHYNAAAGCCRTRSLFKFRLALSQSARPCGVAAPVPRSWKCSPVVVYRISARTHLASARRYNFRFSPDPADIVGPLLPGNRDIGQVPH